MEFQLFKTAAIGTYTLPRIGVLADLLEDQMAPMYSENEAARPELAAAALFLAEHYREMDPDTKLFTSMSGLTPDRLVNKKVLKFTRADMDAFAAAIPNSSVELTPQAAKHLLSIVISEAISMAFTLEIRGNADVLLASKTMRSVDGPMVRTASAKGEDPDAHEGPGRKIRHIPWQRSEAKGPSTRDIRDVYSMLAYNSAFNGLVGAKALDPWAEKTDYLSQLALNFETSRYFDSILGSISKSLSTGKKVRLADGSPLTPNPPIGAFFGADHRQFFAEPDGQIPPTHPTSILQVISHGARGNSDSSYLPFANISRKALYAGQISVSDEGAEDQQELDAHAYTGIAAKASLKTLNGLYGSNPEKMHKDLQDVLLRGFMTQLALIKSNGIALSRIENIAPALKNGKIASEVKKSLVNIIGSLPSSFESFEQAKNLSKKAIEREHARLASVGLTGIALPGHASKQFTNFIDFAAQVVLKLPVNFAQSFQNFDPRGMLRPMPPQLKASISQIKNSSDIFGAGFTPSFDEVFVQVMAPNIGSGAAGFTYNKLMAGKPHQDFFISAAKASKNPSDSLSKSIMGRLKKLNTVIKTSLDKFANKAFVTSAEGTRTVRPELKDSAQIVAEFLLSSPENTQKAIVFFLSGMLASIGVNVGSIDVAQLYMDVESTVVGSAQVNALVKEVARLLPPVWNEADDSVVESEYSNILKYRKNNRALYENPQHPIAAGSGDAAKLHLMHEGSFNNALHLLMSNGMVARYDQNKTEHDTYVEKNYNLPEIDSEDLPRILDIDTKVKEMKKDKVLESFIVSEKSDAQVDLFAPGQKASDKENERKRKVGLKYQEFFNTHSKATVIAKLAKIPRTPTELDARKTYGADYFDAFNVLLAESFHTLFENHINNKLELADIGARAVVGDKRFSEQEIKELRQADDDSSGNKDVKQTDRYSSFAVGWATRPKFAKSNGGFDTQSLAGFMAECLSKKDIAKLGGAEGALAAKFVDRLVMPLDAKRFKTSKESNVPILGLVMNRAVWAYGRITQGQNIATLNRILADNAATGKPGLPRTLEQVTVRVRAFVDPLVTAVSLSKGAQVDTRYKCLLRAFGRIVGEYDNYEDWELDVIAYMGSSRQEAERNISEQGTLSAEQRKMMFDIIDQSARSDQLAWRIPPAALPELEQIGKKMGSVGEIKNEVLWKTTFQYALPQVTEKIGQYAKKGVDVTKLVALTKNNAAIKTVWQIHIAELLGPAGIVEKTDEEKYSIAVTALGMVLEEHSNLLVMSEPEAAVEVAEVKAESAQLKEDSEEADIVTDADDNQFGRSGTDLQATLQELSSKSDNLQVIIAAAKAAAPDFDDVILDEDEDKEAYFEKIFSRTSLLKTPAGIDYILSVYRSKINTLSLAESVPAAVAKELDKALDLTKKTLISKMPVVAPTIHAEVMQEIDRTLATIKTEASSRARAAEQLMPSVERVVAAAEIQKSTAHMASIQRMIFAAAEIVMSRAPVLPKAARYKMAIEGFISFSEDKVRNWNAALLADKTISAYVKFDEDLRRTGSSLDVAGEAVVRGQFKDEGDVVFATDPTIKKLFAARTAVIDKMKMMDGLKAQLAETSDAEIDQFHDQLAKAEEEFGVAQKKNIGVDEEEVLTVEDEEIDDTEDYDSDVVIEEDDLDTLDSADAEEVFELDAEGRPLSDKEMSGRRDELKVLKSSIMGVRAILARFKIIGTRAETSGHTSGDVFLYFGTEILNRIQKAIDDPDFLTKNTEAHMKEMAKVMSDMRQYFASKTGTMHPLTPEEEETLTSKTIEDVQGFLVQFGEILDRPIDRPKAKDVAPVAADSAETAPAKSVRRTEPGAAKSKDLVPVGSTLEQKLNAEIASVLSLLNGAIESEQATGGRLNVLQNAIKMISAFDASNRDFSAKADLATLIKFVESSALFATDQEHDTFAPSGFQAFIDKLKGKGFVLKEDPVFDAAAKPAADLPVLSKEHSQMTTVLKELVTAVSQIHPFHKFVTEASDKTNKEEVKIAAKQFLATLSSLESAALELNGLFGYMDQAHSYEGAEAKHIATINEMISRISQLAEDGIEAISSDAVDGFVVDKKNLDSLRRVEDITKRIVRPLKEKVAKASAPNPTVIKTSDGWLLG